MEVSRAAALLLAAGVFCVMPVDASDRSGGYIHDLFAPDSNLSIVINIAGDTASLQSSRGADPLAEPGRNRGQVRLSENSNLTPILR